GAAILAQETMQKIGGTSKFYGWDIPDQKFNSRGFECDGCPNVCEIVEIRQNNELIARWGSRCGKWDDLEVESPIKA
ncbi:MAG: 2-hydroxyglutaryl-CoA dehydratase, partial [Candidatus Heimdallarchaeota archaeon]|nr:2-hydroxyglutaryl-CoA dehydratase [Candidatus Heimdallarchaeota archaeon]